MKFVTNQDKQLWFYNIGEYQIPVYATPGTVDDLKHWRIMPAVFLLPRAFSAIDSVIGPVSLIKYAGCWLVPDQKFIAAKADGVTPEYYLKQPDLSKEPKMTAYDLVAQIREAEHKHAYSDDFIKDVWQRTNICDIKLLRLIWHTLCQEMPRWMLQHQKPLDLGWSRMVVLPYRVNWKQIVLSKFPHIWNLLSLPQAEREVKLSLSDFPVELISTSLTALTKAGARRTIRWTVEIDPNQLWWEYSDETEKRMLEAQGPDSYLKRYATILRKLLPLATDVFRNFVRQTTLPSAAILKRRGNRGQELVDHVQPGSVQPRNSEGGPVRITTDTNAMALHDAKSKRIVALTPKKLPEMQVVDFGVRDVRDAGGDVQTPERQGGADRVLVQPETGSAPPAEGVLGAEHGSNGHGVA